jgi:hypothetical protein
MLKPISFSFSYRYPPQSSSGAPQLGHTNFWDMGNLHLRVETWQLLKGILAR